MSYSKACCRVRNSTASPWPTSSSSTASVPLAGGGTRYSSNGSNRQPPSARPLHDHGNRASSVPASAASSSGHGNSGTAYSGAPASRSTHHQNSCAVQTAASRSHGHGSSAASKANGVSSSDTSGVPSALASGDTNGSWPKNSASGSVDASVTSNCTCSAVCHLPPGARRPATITISAATSPNDSQKPGASTANGSSSNTSVSAASQICNGDSPRWLASARAATSSIHRLRCVGTEKPASAA